MYYFKGVFMINVKFKGKVLYVFNMTLVPYVFI